MYNGIHPGPGHPCDNIYNIGVPGPVPSPTYRIPHTHDHIHPPRPPRPENMKYVTKRELNEVLSNIFKATTYTDTSENGTAISIGGIKKGTKFTSTLTFNKLVETLLFTSSDEATGDSSNTTVNPPINDTTEFVTATEFNDKIRELTALIAELSTKIDNINEKLNNIDTGNSNNIDTSNFVTIDKHISDITDAKSELTLYTDNKFAAVNNRIDNLNLSGGGTDVDTTNFMTTEMYNANINTVKTELKQYTDNKVKDLVDAITLESSIEDVKTEANAYTDGKIDNITTRINNISAAIDDCVTESEYTTNMNNTINALKEYTDTKTGNLVNANTLSTTINSTKTELKQYTDGKIEENKIDTSSLLTTEIMDSMQREEAVLMAAALYESNG
jgi:hypothetical protein